MTNFFEEEARKFESSTRATIRSTATEVQKVTRLEIRRNFKSKNGTHLGIKVYHFDTGSRVSLSPAFMKAFTEGKTIRGRTNLIVLLPDGERLGFKRINASNTWANLWRRIQKKCKLTSVSDGTVVLYSHRGKNYAIYKFQKSLNRPKLLSIRAKAEDLALALPQNINRQMEKLDER